MCLYFAQLTNRLPYNGGASARKTLNRTSYINIVKKATLPEIFLKSQKN